MKQRQIANKCEYCEYRDGAWYCTTANINAEGKIVNKNFVEIPCDQPCQEINKNKCKWLMDDGYMEKPKTRRKKKEFSGPQGKL